MPPFTMVRSMAADSAARIRIEGMSVMETSRVSKQKPAPKSGKQKGEHNSEYNITIIRFLPGRGSAAKKFQIRTQVHVEVQGRNQLHGHDNNHDVLRDGDDVLGAAPHTHSAGDALGAAVVRAQGRQREENTSSRQRKSLPLCEKC